jgi:hypothetical protein
MNGEKPPVWFWIVFYLLLFGCVTRFVLFFLYFFGILS